MRRLVVTEYITLDGIFEEPGQWSFPFWSEEAAAFKYDELFASDAQLLGRVTYEGFAQAWPTMTDDAGFAARMNGMAKYAVSTTLANPTWNNTRVVKGNIAEEVSRLKQEPGKDILVAGSGQLVHTLTELGLVDEYRFMVHPISLGNGRRLFEGRHVFKLVDVKQFSSGVVVLTYQAVPKENTLPAGEDRIV